MIVLLTTVGLLSLAVALHPFITYPLSLLLLRRFGRKHPAAQISESTDPLRCAICVCAYNEERAIEAKIRNLLALRARHPDLELLVYVDASTDRTAEILRAWQRRHPGESASRLQILLRGVIAVRKDDVSERQLLEWSQAFDKFQAEMTRAR